MFCQRHSTICSVIGVGSFVVSFALVVLFPDQSVDKAKQITDMYPKILVDTIGDPMEIFSDIYAWIHAQFYHASFWIIYGLYAGDLATDIIAEDIEDKSIDIILSYPVARSEIIINRLIGLIILLVFSTIPFVFGCSLGIIKASQELNVYILIIATLMGFLISLNFAAVTLLITTLFPRSMFSLGLTLCIFGFMFVYEGMLTKLIPVLDKLSFMSLFHYYQPSDILIRRTFTIWHAVVLSFTFIILIFICVTIFRRKDILV
jgi:ABC-2 type transport system permease protein